MITYFLFSTVLTVVFGLFFVIKQSKIRLIYLSLFFFGAITFNYWLMPILDPRTYPVWLEIFAAMLLGSLCGKNFRFAGFTAIILAVVTSLMFLMGSFDNKFEYASEMQQDKSMSELYFMSDVYIQNFNADFIIKTEDGEMQNVKAGQYRLGYFKGKNKIAIYDCNSIDSFFAVEINGKKVSINYKPEAKFNYNLKRRLLNALPFYTDTEFVYRGIRIAADGTLYQVMERLELIRGFYTSTGYILVNAENGYVETHGIIPEWLR